MLVVFEGADGVGKTTAAKRLMEYLLKTRPGDAVRLEHFGPPKDHPLCEYELGLDGYRPGERSHLIVDRLHWSQEVYGPRYRGLSELGRPGVRHIDLYLRSRGALMVHLTDSPRAIVERLEARGGDEYGPIDDAPYLVQRYWEATQRTILPVLTYRFGEFDPIEVAREAERVTSASKRLALYPSYIGSPTPRTLFLVDSRPEPKPLPDHEAALPAYPGTSGFYLLDKLSSLDGVVNADTLDIGQLHTLWSKLKRPRVVGLGPEVLTKAYDAAIPPEVIGQAPHPQYWQTFHPYEPELYVQMLNEAACGYHASSYPIY